MVEQELSVPDQDHGLSTEKRGLDLAKVEYVMGREQERDLKLIYRFDQIQAFCKAPEEERKRYNFERKPSDPLLVQHFWEAQRQYKVCSEACRQYEGEDMKACLEYAHLSLKWFEKCLAINDRCEEKRKEAMDRLMSWKKHAEDQGLALDDKTSEELEELAAKGA